MSAYTHTCAVGRAFGFLTGQVKNGLKQEKTAVVCIPNRLAWTLHTCAFIMKRAYLT